MANTSSTGSPKMVKKFYFLDYFLILLQSFEFEENRDRAFIQFKILKDKERLGESKYRKISQQPEEPTEVQDSRYQYTFDQVIAEAKYYKIIEEVDDKIFLSSAGQMLLETGWENRREFYEAIFHRMENYFHAFRHLVELCYEQNQAKGGLLIFPIYSPLKLGFIKKDMKTYDDWLKYLSTLRVKLEGDVQRFIGVNLDLKFWNKQLIERLKEEKFLSPGKIVKTELYNALNGRIRTFWLTYFLKELYRYPYSYDTFNIWVERGKQLGIFYSTDFYPHFDGRLVFPTSILVNGSSNRNFTKIFEYPDKKKLLIHKPSWEFEENQELFIDTLTEVYFSMRKNRKSHLYFMRLPDIRERVCYQLRIPAYVFNHFLQETYLLNLKGETRIRVSLEADRLPQETGAMYLKREPILINDQYKNIIAIDFNK